jgi:hypothetical protein
MNYFYFFASNNKIYPKEKEASKREKKRTKTIIFALNQYIHPDGC